MKKVLIGMLTLCLFTVAAFAQSSAGRLGGTVSGPDGSIPGATIVVTDNQTKKERTITASDEGSFSVPQLEPGEYTVTITATGFKTFTATDVKIDANREYTLNPTLEVGGVSENVTVVAGADVVNSSNGELSNTVSPKQIQELPLDGRSPLSLIPLQAGSAKATPGSVTSINGQRTSFTNLTRDGINVNDNFIRANATDFSPERASSDDTGEFTITTQNAGAESGYGAAQVQLVTPRGTTDYHGALYEYNRNSRFAANTFPNNASRLPRSFLNRNQFGGKVSGPIPFTAKKLFFFFDYERQYLRQANTFNTVVLGPLARTGVFRYTDTGGVSRSVNLFTLTPAAGAAGGPAAPTGISPVIQSRLLAGMPLPNGTTGLNTANHTISQGFNDDYTYYTGRIDFDINDRNTVNAVYTYKREDLQRPDVTRDSFTFVPPVTQPGINKFVALSWVSTLSSNLSNEVRGGFSFPEANFNRITPIPSFFLTSTLVNLPDTTFLNQGRLQHNYNIQDNATLTMGNHSFRFGGLAQIFRVKPFNDAGINPQFGLAISTNSPQLTAASFAGVGPISATSLATANSLYALLGGIIGSGQQTFNPSSATGPFAAQTLKQLYAFENYALYFNDQWRIRPQFTLNLGLRYEINTALKLQNGIAVEPVIPEGADPIQAILDPNGSYQAVGGNSGGNGRFYKDDKNNFGPVISFAYSPEFKNDFLGSIFPGGGRTVLRGGFRISFVPDQFLTSARNANAGNVGLGSTALAAVVNGSSQLNLRVDQPATIPAVPVPTVPTFPRPFTVNNGAAFSNFGTVFGVDPDLQSGRTQEYSFGIQREIGFQSVIEVRYVGSYSNNLIRAADFNQVDIVNNGFLADFRRAQANFALTGNAFCVSAGCQPLTVFGTAATSPLRVAPAAGGLALATFNAALQAGTPGQLTLSFLNGNQDFNANRPAGSQQFPIIPNNSTGVADLLYNGARYNYNSLQIEIRRRFAQGFAFQANYTFAKNLTDAIGTSQALVDTFLDNFRPELEYSRSDFDQTHTFNFNGIYELPFGKGKRFLNEGGLLNKVIGGFQLSTIIRYGSGRPTSILDPRGTFNRTARSARQTANSSLTKDQIKDLFGRFTYHGPLADVLFYINPSVLNITQTRNADGSVSTTSLATNGPGVTPFANQVFFNVPAGEVGQLERGFINGPKQFTMDLALSKRISISERMGIQLRLEAFNVLNHNNYLIGQLLDINSTSFGQLTDGLSEQAQGLDSPRRLQFAFRFEF
jgi:Carboxypeptidase regulatory-like domain